MRKKIGNAVKRNRIKRKLKSIVYKLLKKNSSINIDYTYIVFGKSKVYDEDSLQLFEKMRKSFKSMGN
jgi:ribonuclease P protein component